MTFRNETDALRAKLDAAEAENRRLRDELQHDHVTEKQKAASERSAARRAWLQNVGAGAGTLLRGLILLAFGAGLVIGIVYVCSWIDSVVDAQRAARRQAEADRLEELRSHVPPGVDRELWSWCVNHCTRFGQTGNSYEGVITEVFIDHGDGSETRTLVTIQGPWLNSSGATQITASFNVDYSLQVGDLIIVNTTRDGVFVERARPIPPVAFGPP